VRHFFGSVHDPNLERTAEHFEPALLPQTDFPLIDRVSILPDKINPTESNKQLIWTPLGFEPPVEVLRTTLQAKCGQLWRKHFISRKAPSAA
jgi:hypothetical protein